MASDLSPSALRIAIVGPAHPAKGGVAAHTTTLAHELAEAGHDVTLVSWSHLYPRLLYPGEQGVPMGAPDVTPFPRTLRVLSWARPDSWVRAGRRLRGMDAIVIVHVIPPVVPAHLALLTAATSGSGSGSGSDARGDQRPRILGIAHNVLPHESRPGDRTLMRAFVQRVDSLIVHSDEQAALARDLGAAHVRELDLPPHLPGGPRVPHVASDGPTRLLALGIVRDYKGVDLLLEAVRAVPDVQVTVAGELWGEAGRRVQELAEQPDLRGRVEVLPGYVPADQIADLMARHDVLTLTYRHATASQNVQLARRHGLPVLATEVGTFGDQVVDGLDGLLVPPGQPTRLTEAVRRLTEPGYAAQLRDAVRPPDEAGPWADYVGLVEALASPQSRAVSEVGPAAGLDEGAEDRREATPEPLRDRASHAVGVVASGLESAVDRARDAATALADRLPTLANPELPALRGTDFPEHVQATDVLAQDVEALETQAWARAVGLPRVSDAVAGWAALGALAAILRISDDGRRKAVIVDESGPRSVLSRWSRALGFAPVDLGLTGLRSPMAALDLDARSLDVIAKLHPRGCSASDVGDVLARASWALRPGGLLILTLPLGEEDPQWALRPADVRGVLAQAADLGLVLVGDLDGELMTRMRQAARAAAAREDDATAYGILRLTLRRRAT